MTTIGQLLLLAQDDSTPVAQRWSETEGSERLLRWGDFRRDVAALRGRLEHEPQGAWILLTEDAYAFAVGLFSLWHAGRHAILPPNRQSGSLRAIQTRAAGVLCDRPDWFAEGTSLSPLGDYGAADPDALAPLYRDSDAVVLYTSGSTGGEKPVAKRIAHLDDEVQELAARWDERVRGTTVFATASHQHLYGLLFGVLWPLCSGHLFQARHYLHAGELIPRMRAADACTLASVPTHLKRMARHADASRLAGVCRTVFSSGGPLATSTAHALAQAMGFAPIEVLGSTETGIIAFRSQEPGSAHDPWRSPDVVHVHRDTESGVLRVRSPFVSVVSGEESFSTGDRIQLLADGRFELAGRADRVVNVGEKRLDLAQMESQLRGHAWVDEVALATIEKGDELRVAAAIVPSEAGTTALEEGGRRTFSVELRRDLAKDWDPILHPRYWRAVQRLPENAQAKVTVEAIRQLFGNASGDDTATSERPEVLEEFRGRDTLEHSCVVPHNLACLPGHFQGYAVVPGVLQLDWAMDLAAQLLGSAPRVEKIENLKLLAPLLPGTRFRIQVQLHDGNRALFKLWNEDELYTRGHVRLAPRNQESSR